MSINLKPPNYCVKYPPSCRCQNAPMRLIVPFCLGMTRCRWRLGTPNQIVPFAKIRCATFVRGNIGFDFTFAVNIGVFRQNLIFRHFDCATRIFQAACIKFLAAGGGKLGCFLVLTK